MDCLFCVPSRKLELELELEEEGRTLLLPLALALALAKEDFMNQPDPQKAIVLKPNQRRLPGGERDEKTRRPRPQWEPHQSDQALDAWGTALRVLREQGHDFSSPVP
jgi:hypothetical protein